MSMSYGCRMGVGLFFGDPRCRAAHPPLPPNSTQKAGPLQGTVRSGGVNPHLGPHRCKQRMGRGKLGFEAGPPTFYPRRGFTKQSLLPGT